MEKQKGVELFLNSELETQTQRHRISLYSLPPKSLHCPQLFAIVVSESGAFFFLMYVSKQKLA